MEPEPAKATVEHEKEIKPELVIKNKDDDIHKQPLEKNTSPRLSSSSSASSSLSLEFAADENDLSSAPVDDPWSMLSASSEPALSTEAGYDPNRIPSSIFASKAGEGWSVASNESLFSIHMGGNNSFSGDHAILCEKSGELGRLDDWNNENELMVSTGGLSTVIEETSGGISRVESGPDLVTGSKSLSMPRTSRASTNRLSDDSRNSCASFAFPVLVDDGVKTGGSSRKDVMTEQRRSEEVCNTSPPQQGPPGEKQGGGYNWYSRLCCCCCSWPRCC